MHHSVPLNLTVDILARYNFYAGKRRSGVVRRPDNVTFFSATLKTPFVLSFNYHRQIVYFTRTRFGKEAKEDYKNIHTMKIRLNEL